MVISGESGAVGIGLLSLISKYKELDEIKKMLEINEIPQCYFLALKGILTLKTTLNVLMTLLSWILIKKGDLGYGFKSSVFLLYR